MGLGPPRAVPSVAPATGSRNLPTRDVLWHRQSRVSISYQQPLTLISTHSAHATSRRFMLHTLKHWRIWAQVWNAKCVGSQSSWALSYGNGSMRAGLEWSFHTKALEWWWGPGLGVLDSPGHCSLAGTQQWVTSLCLRREAAGLIPLECSTQTLSLHWDNPNKS